ncbi:MAG: SelB C-terminal domain-containing protein, partial [Longimicrobiales bacterium]|nr:SelB C-terminal domain-containing protein [Longimicrobiales bacterium]
PDTGWSIEHGQRVRVHTGTAEVMARCSVLSGGEDRSAPHLAPGTGGWVQLRLEAPVAARVGGRVIVRAWSPVTTIAGGEIAEVHPPRRRRGSAAEAPEVLDRRLSPEPLERVRAALAAAGRRGMPAARFPLETGLAPAAVEAAWERARAVGAVEAPDGTRFDAEVVDPFATALRREVDRVHREHTYLPGLDVARARAEAGPGAHSAFADTVLAREIERGTLELRDGAVRRPGFEPTLSTDQVALRNDLLALLEAAGFEAPRLDDLPERLRTDPAFLSILRALEADERVVALEDDLYIDGATLRRAVDEVRERFAGREDLGPGDFREVIPVSRRHLLPILAWLDRSGVTRFDGKTRCVRA